MQKIDFGIKLQCPNSNLPKDSRNIVYRAVQIMQRKINYKIGIEILLHKKILIAAGLGGGSSNVAITLVAINNLFEFGLSLNNLCF